MRIIHQNAFCKCQNLKKVVLNEGLEILGTDECTPDGRPWYGVFQDSALESIELPSTLRRIEYNAFQSCKRLKSITLPDKLEYVGECCFWRGRLQKVRIPSAGVEAGEDAFSGYLMHRDFVVRDGRIFQKR